MPNVSASWKASVPISFVETCPVSATIGIESIIASTKPVTRLVAPGPGCRAAHADSSRRASIALRGKRRILFVPNQDVANRVIVQRVVEGQRDAARITEDALDVFARQTFKQNLCAG